MENKFFKKIDAILTGKHNFEKHEYVLMYQIALLKILIALSSLLIGFMAFVRLYQGHIGQSVLDFVFVFILIVSFRIINRNKRHFKAISRGLLGFGVFTILVLMRNMPESFAPVVWVSTTIYLMFFLLSWERLGIGFLRFC